LFCDKLARLLGMKKFKSLNECQKVLEVDDEKSSTDTGIKEQIDDQIQEENELKCKFAAIVMDRFFLYLASFYSIITFVSLIMAIPNFYK
jgi:hypothetical protein